MSEEKQDSFNVNSVLECLVKAADGANHLDISSMDLAMYEVTAKDGDAPFALDMMLMTVERLGDSHGPSELDRMTVRLMAKTSALLIYTHSVVECCAYLFSTPEGRELVDKFMARAKELDAELNDRIAKAEAAPSN